MKTLKIKLTFLFSLMLAALSVAQNGINYKAIVKDDLGNVVANQTIDVQFMILKGTAQTTVYQETHTPLSDDNGIIVVNIGEGTTTDDFATLDWGEDIHFLNVQIDIGSGFMDMGTTKFKAVPYALYAANVTGLEAIDEGNGLGWRLTGRDEAFYGTINIGAVDFSTSQQNTDTNGATGQYAFASGVNTLASGNRSTAIGNFTTASSYAAIAMGSGASAIADGAVAIGLDNSAEAFGSVAFGFNTVSDNEYATVFGVYNDNTISSSYLFQVGNGTSSVRSNAFNIDEDGTITAPSFDMSEIIDNKALITKEYADANYSGGSGESPTGLEAIDEGNGIGWRLIGVDPNNYGNIGQYATNLSYSPITSDVFGATGAYAFATGLGTIASGIASTAMGTETIASENFSTAFGRVTTASGSSSTAFGRETTASGSNSTAMGSYTNSSGVSSTAMGSYTNASESYTTAMGYGTIANAEYSTAIGRYNIGNVSGGGLEFQPLFEIGYGSSTEPSNVLTVLKNGYIGIDTHTPVTKLQITGGTEAAYITESGYMVIGDTNTNNIVFDNNEILARNNGASSTLYLQQDGGDVSVGGTVVHSSDRRLKKNIQDIKYGLKDILKLNPKQYNWINRGNKKMSLGLIAQDVQRIIEEIILVGTDEQQTLSLSYTELIPVLIQAIKDQQAIIDNQKQVITSQEETNTKQTEVLQALLERVEVLEKQSKRSHIELAKN